MSHGTCETVKVKSDNEQGFVVCNADEVPEGAELFVEVQENTGPSTKADYQTALKELGVEFESGDNKAVLVAKYEESTKEPEE